MAKQEISIQLLRPGMHVVGIDVSWLDSPFLRHSFRIESQEDIRKLLGAGVKLVTIERSKSDVLPEQVEQELAGADEERSQAVSQDPSDTDHIEQDSAKNDQESESAPGTSHQSAKIIDLQEAKSKSKRNESDLSENGPSEPDEPEDQTPSKRNIPAGPTSLKQELGVAKQIYGDVRKLCKQVFEQLEQGKNIDVDRVADLAEQTTESLARNNQAIFSFLLMQRKDSDLHDHAFSVFSLVLALAQTLKVPQQDYETLALAALLHDVGWLKLPLHLLGKGKAYTEPERKLVIKHPLLSAKMLESAEGVGGQVGNLIALHHERMDGSGYPTGKAVPENLLWSILVVADRYDELVHQLLDRAGMVPKVALKQLYKEAQQGQFDIQVVQCLVTLMGVYPISSALQLKSGEKAVVTECHRSAPSQPIIRVYYDKRGQLMKRAEDVDLSLLDPDDPRQIAKAIDWRVPGVDPAQVLNIAEADLR